VRFVLCFLIVGTFSVPCVAQVQPGSTGGSIGKTDKSISGGESGEPSTPTKSRSRGQRPVDRGSSDQSSDVSVAGRWHWSADCSVKGWQGDFDLAETSRGNISGNFAGTSWYDVGTITNGHINGSSITFTRKNALVTQFWKGHLAAGRIKGTLSGNDNCSWEATRK
jgi:hypothetical protein